MYEARSPDGWFFRVTPKPSGCTVDYLPRVQYDHGARLVVGVLGVRSRGMAIPGLTEEPVLLGELEHPGGFVAATLAASVIGLRSTFDALSAGPLIDGMEYDVMDGAHSIARVRYVALSDDDFLVLDTGESVFQVDEVIDRLWPSGSPILHPDVIFASDV